MVAQAIAKGLTALAARGGKEAGEVAAEVSPLRKIFDALPEERIADIPKQPDDIGLFGYHGSAKGRVEKEGEDYFDIEFGNPNDQFMGEGFYFTIDPRMAEEYANLRATKDFQWTARTFPDPFGQRGKGKGNSLYINKKTKQWATLDDLMAGVDIDGNSILAGQNISRFDLGGLRKPFIVNNNKQRLYAKENIEKLKEEGYDSIMFRDFEDRSQQILVFPEHIGKVAGKTTEELIPQRLFHGTPNPDIKKFKYSKEGVLGEGVYLTPDPKYASTYATGDAANVIPVTADIKNPLIVQSTGVEPSTDVLKALGVSADKAAKITDKAFDDKGNITKEISTRARKQGYDAVILKNKDGNVQEIVSYKPDNISSAITGKNKGGSIIERNPYNYSPRSI